MNDLEADLLIANAKIRQLEQQLTDYHHLSKLVNGKMEENQRLRRINENLQEQLAASQHRERAAVEDLKKHRKYKCDCCYYADKQGRYIPCRDCQSPISNYGDGWQWRGPQEVGKGEAE